MDYFLFGNLAWNTGLVAIAGFMFKRWMDKIEIQLKDNCTDSEKETDKLYTELKGIYGQLKVANSRTSKNEEQIHVQAALCAERTRHGAISCQVAGNKELEV